MAKGSFMSPKEAAAYLEVHRHTIYRYFKIPMAKGGIPRKKIPGSTIWKIPREKFIRWANAGTGD